MDTTTYKNMLLAEKSRLERELESVGAKNPEMPTDWEPEPETSDVISADETEVADRLESYTENTAIMNDLEPAYNDVLAALDRIEKGTYGMCEVCGAAIEAERLNANPAARTCIAHREG